jgi:hypothetical protein
MSTTALTVLLGAIGLAVAGAGAAAPTGAIVVEGTVTLKAFDVTKDCRWGGTRTATEVGCTVYGAYTGLPGPAGAGYGWTWNVPFYGKGGRYGFERGTLVLNFGNLGGVSLSLTGKQKPVGKQTTAHAKVVTTGTWRMTKGTSSLAGEHGKGTYTYTIVRTGSPTLFSFASLVLAGSIIREPAPA